MKPKSNTEKTVIYDSMSAASGGIGMSLRALREAKQSGCPAFRSNRVNADQLLQWWSNEFERDGLKIPPEQVVEILSIVDLQLGTK